MLESTDITLQSVADPAFQSRLAAAITEYQNNYLVGDAHEVFVALERVLADQALPDADVLKEKLHDEFILLMYLSLPLLDEAQVLQLLGQHLMLALTHDIIVEELIGRRLDLYYDTELDSVQTRKILEAISHNDEMVIAQGLTATGDTHTVSDWIKRLLGTHGSSKAINTLEIIQFLESQPGLSAEPKQKDLVRRVLLLYARVQSVFVTGIMDVLFMPLQEQYALIDAESNTTGKPAQKKSVDDGRALTLLKSRYTRYRQSQAGVLAEEDRLMATTRGDIQNLKQALAAASREGSPETLVAALKILCHQDALVSALQSSKAWLTATANYIEQKYDGRGTAANIQKASRAIQAGQVTPQVVSEFLQYLLIEKLKMTGNDAALVGVHIGQLLGGEYEQMAYGNQDTGHFEWAQHEITEQGLVDAE